MSWWLRSGTRPVRVGRPEGQDADLDVDRRGAAQQPAGAWVDLILDDVPQPFDGVVVNEATLEALMLVAGEAEESRLSDDDLLEMIQSAELQPRILYPSGFKRKSRFAFVIHPLSQEYFPQREGAGRRRRRDAGDLHGRRGEADGARAAVRLQPCHRYHLADGRRGRRLAHHRRRHAEGTDGTTRVHLLPAPRGSRHGTEDGRQIAGLGAFTRWSATPVSGGQAGTASHHHRQLLQRFGCAVDIRRGPPARHRGSGRKGHIKGQRRWWSARPAPSARCARLLAMAADELWLVSIEPAKLLALKADIERESPRATIHVGPTPTGTSPTWTSSSPPPRGRQRCSTS